MEWSTSRRDYFKDILMGMKEESSTGYWKAADRDRDRAWSISSLGAHLANVGLVRRLVL